MKTYWLSKKRFWILVGGALSVLIAFFISLRQANVSWIVVYNMTGEPLPPLRIEACGQSRLTPPLPNEGSYRWKLAPRGTPSEIALEMAVDPPWRWRGGYIEPQGGYLVTLRIWPDRQVEEHFQFSFWQQVFHPNKTVSE